MSKSILSPSWHLQAIAAEVDRRVSMMSLAKYMVKDSVFFDGTLAVLNDVVDSGLTVGFDGSRRESKAVSSRSC